MKSYTLFLAATLVITGCTSTESVVNNQQDRVELTELPCTFPDAADVKAPTWVCEGKIKGLEVQAMGMSDNSAAGISHQRHLALLDGQTVLATQLNSEVKAAIKKFTATKGSNKSMMKTSATEEDLTSNLDKEIRSMTIYQSVRSPKGTYFVLVGLDKKAYELNIEDKIRTEINQNGQLWQPANTDNSATSNEALINDISAYVNN